MILAALGIITNNALFAAQPSASSDEDFSAHAIVETDHCPASVTLTDPLKRMLNARKSEIPDSSLEEDTSTITDPDDVGTPPSLKPKTTAFINTLSRGSYKVTLTGIGSGKCNLEIMFIDSLGHAQRFERRFIMRPKKIVNYSFDFTEMRE